MIFTQTSTILITTFIILLVGGFFGVYTYVHKKSLIIHKKNKMTFLLIILFLSTICFFLALFGPKSLLQYSHFEKGNHIAFVLDVSKSMNVQDIGFNSKKASRLFTAKQAITEFVSTHTENDYSLTIFAGSSQGILPFTNDKNIFLTFLEGVGEQNVNEGGTDLLSGVSDAIDTFTRDQQGGVIVVFSDGGDEYEKQQISKISKKIHEKNIQIFIVSIGTSQGGYIPVGVDDFGDVSYKIYNGRKVISRRNDSISKTLSSEFGGKFMVFDDVGDFGEFEENIYTLGEKSYILQDDVGKSLQYFFVLLGSFFFFISFLLSIFDIDFLGKRKY